MVKGWTKKRLGEMFDISGGLSVSRAQLSDNGHPYLHYGDIHGSQKTFIELCEDSAIPRLDVPLSKVTRVSLLQNGDIVFVDASEDDEGASRHIVVRNAKNLPFISGLHTIVAKARTNELENLYREFCFQTAAIKSQFKFYAVGTKVVGVNKKSIKDIVVEFPTDKAEQRAISTALSDTDAYIASLEEVIAKKRAIKQGTMQALLTGKRRLALFSGQAEWAEKKLGDTGEIIIGGTPPTAVGEYWNGDILWVTPTDITDKKDIQAVERKISEAGLAKIRELPPNTLLVTCVASIGKNAVLRTKGASNQQINAIVPFEDYDVDFLYYLVEINRPLLESKAGITATKIVSKTEFSEIELRFPPTKTEQLAISGILSDMDSELDVLTEKLTKARRIKQGMMSELLTGRIRLV